MSDSHGGGPDSGPEDPSLTTPSTPPPAGPPPRFAGGAGGIPRGFVGSTAPEPPPGFAGGTPTPPRGFAGPGPVTPSMASPQQPRPQPAAPAKRSPARFLIPLILVLALAAGGFWFVGHSGDDEAARSAEPTTAETTSTTAVPTFVATTTVNPIEAPWTTITDKRSGITFKLPGTRPDSTERILSDYLPDLDPPTRYGVMTAGAGAANNPIDVSVYVWDPEMGASQSTIDRLFERTGSRAGSVNAPYPKRLTIAGQPATAKDTSNGSIDGTSGLTAAATIDGTLVVVHMYAVHDEPVNAAMFEQVLSTFSKV